MLVEMERRKMMDRVLRLLKEDSLEGKGRTAMGGMLRIS